MQIQELAKYGIPEWAIEKLKQNKIEKLNPAQEAAVKSGLLNGKNLVLSSPTASGKTLVAILAIAKAVSEKRCKALYIVPLRALASEKHEELKEFFSINKGTSDALINPVQPSYKVAISTGDYDNSDEKLGLNDIIVVTVEKLDSLMRHNISWLNTVGMVVADEVHLLNDTSRGPTLEIVLTKIKRLKAQVLALSATIKNVPELAGWLEAEKVVSEYRPVKLWEGVYDGNRIKFLNREEKKLEGRAEGELALVADTMKMGKQAIVFAGTRKNAESSAEKAAEIVSGFLENEEKEKLKGVSEKILSALGSPTKQCKKISELVKSGAAFHHAGLANSQRKLIEQGFREGLIKIICATPTLAAGVNLPAFRCIMRDMKRFYAGFGSRYIPVLEYKQMCLHGNTKILLETGELKAIKDIVQHRIDKKVLSYSKGENKIIPKRITNYSRRKVNKIFVIKNSLGKKLLLTGEHPLLCLREGKMTWVTAKDIKIGDKIAHISNFNLDNTPDLFFYKYIDMNDSYLKNKTSVFKKAKGVLKRRELAAKLNKDLRTIKEYIRGKKAIPLSAIIETCKILNFSDDEISNEIKEVKTAYGNIVKLPKYLNEDFMWLLGIIATDGNIQETVDKRTGSIYHKIRLGNTNQKIIKEYIRILKNLGLKPYISKRDYYNFTEIEIGCTLLAKIMKRFGIPFKNKTSSLKLPDFFFSLPRNLIGAFLAGVFDGDGNYLQIKNKRFPETIDKRILICTSSKDFADDLYNLFLRIGIVSKIEKHDNKYSTEIRGRKVNFTKDVYYIFFRKNKYINNFSKYCKTIKRNISINKYSSYNNLDKKYSKECCIEWIDVISKRLIKSKTEVFNISVEKTENYVAENIIVHNCGRAGRPQFDKEGEAIILAKTQREAEEVFEKYLLGESEEITSKLAVEPILKTHVLALIATGLGTNDEISEFFSKTFHAHQYGNTVALNEKLRNVINELLRWELVEMHGNEVSGTHRNQRFLAEPRTKFACMPKNQEDFSRISGDEISATRIGKRISELYLNPESGWAFSRSLESDANGFGVLQMISSSLEMAPQLRVKNSEYDEISEHLAKREAELMVADEKKIFTDDILDSFKTALFLESWCSEKGEDFIFEKFGVSPGELHARLEIADWLLYCCHEIALLLGRKESLNTIKKMRTRLKYGVKEELLPLVRLRGIGRVRARKLWNSDVRSVLDLRKIPQEKLAAIVGNKVAEEIKEQVTNGNEIDTE